jgi:hypothetical protein
MLRFDTLLDAACYLTRGGYTYDADPAAQPQDGSQHWRRYGWVAVIRPQKNGRVRVETGR